MSRNHSPTSDLSENLEALVLTCERQDQSNISDRSLTNDCNDGIWRENSIRLNQEDNGQDQQHCEETLKDNKWTNNHLTNIIDSQLHTGPAVTCNCMCHYQQTHKGTCESCDCHMTCSNTPPTVTQRLSCRQEALYNDITVEDLAGYLDELLYLPKPMSDMAELMYT
jgi:hypothetical protein